MKNRLLLLLAGALTFTIPFAARAQTNSIETDANLKDSTVRVVEERKVYETKKVYQQDTPNAPRKAARL